VVQRRLFPKVYNRRRQGTGVPQGGGGTNQPYTTAEINRLRRALLEGAGALECPRCEGVLTALDSARRSETGAVVWRGRCDACKRYVAVRAVPPSAIVPPDFANLVVSDPPKERLAQAPRWMASVAAHGVVIALAVFATQQVGTAESEVATDTTRVVLLAARPPAPKPPREPPRRAAPRQRTVVFEAPPLPKGFQTLQAPVKVPVELPPIDSGARFDPRDFTGIGVEGGVWDGWEGPGSDVGGSGTEPVPAGVVDEPPRVLSSPRVRYPEVLRAAGVQGIVVVGFVIDTTGRAEPESIHVVASSHRGFDASAKEVIEKSRFLPGRMQGRPVRTLASQRVEFNLLAGKGNRE
jgi:TonB family protein